MSTEELANGSWQALATAAVIWGFRFAVRRTPSFEISIPVKQAEDTMAENLKKGELFFGFCVVSFYLNQISESNMEDKRKNN